MAWVAAAAVIASAAVSAYGSYRQGQEQKKAYEYNAAVAEQKGAYEEEQARKRLHVLLGRQRALYAKAGVDLGSGSPLLVMESTAAEGEREALNLRRFAGQEAGLSRMYGRTAETVGILTAGSTFLSGLANAGGMYYGGKAGYYRFKNPYTGRIS